MSAYVTANLSRRVQAARQWSILAWYCSRHTLNTIAKYCTVVLVAPIKAYRVIQTEFRRRHEWPKPLSLRQHPPNVPTSTTKEHLDNVGIFARLPCELRLRIYEYVLGGKQINIVHCPRKRRLAHRCQLYDPANPEDNLRSVCEGEHWTKPPCNMGPLLRTCRLIYTEAAEVLYTRNSFGIYRMDNMAALVCFLRTIRPERLASITRLTIVIQNWWCLNAQVAEIKRTHQLISYNAPIKIPEFTYPHSAFRDPDRNHPWRQMWRVIAKEMTELKELNLKLVDWKFDVLQRLLLLDIGADWVLPILQVAGLEKFTFTRTIGENADKAFGCQETVAELERKLQNRLYAKSRPER